MKMLATLLAFFCALLTGQSSEATILTFPHGAFNNINQNYGDNVATLPVSGSLTYGNDGSPTPNVTLSYTNVDWGTSGGIPGVTYPTSGQTLGTIWSYTFSAAPGFSVVLDSIDYGHLISELITTYPTVSYSVTGGTPAVFTGFITPNTALTSLQTLDLGGVIGQTMTLTFEITTARVGGNPGLGFDNLIFTQVAVPEASSFGLLACGLAGLWTALRKRQSPRRSTARNVS